MMTASLVAMGHKLTDRVEAADRACAWYLLRTATRQEAKAEERLIERGLAVYVPRMERMRWSRVKRKREPKAVPLFDGYMFAGLPMGWSMRAFRVEGVSAPVRFSAERPVPVALGMIEKILGQELAGQYEAAKVAEPLKEGDEVRVLEGPFAGFPAWVVKLSRKDRVKLLVAVFGRLSDITVKVVDVERAA